MRAAPDAMRRKPMCAEFCRHCKEANASARQHGSVRHHIIFLRPPPGHTAFAINSGSESMLVLSDVTNHPWLFARHPEWQGIFDMDGSLAVTTRRRLLDRAVADRMLVAGYHFPFPAAGHIVRAGSGYDLVPVMWQPL